MVNKNAESNNGPLRPNLSLITPETTAPKIQPTKAELIAQASKFADVVISNKRS
jgi:hypothetical protein